MIKVIIKQFSFLMLLFFFLGGVFGALSEEAESIKFLNLNAIDSSKVNRVSYEITYLQDESIVFDKFVVDIYYDGSFKESCEKQLKYDSTVVSEKITCEMLKYGEGEYKFVASIYSNDEKISSTTSIEIVKNLNKYDFFSQNATLEFIDLGDKTLVIIEVKGEGKNMQVLNFIPKEVISFLDENNKDDLIVSDFEYTIVESDPLIAWTVDKAPAKINYTINKKISLEEKKNFTIDIQDESTFNKFKWVIYILILIIIALALKPAFKRD